MVRTKLVHIALVMAFLLITQNISALQLQTSLTSEQHPAATLKSLVKDQGTASSDSSDSPDNTEDNMSISELVQKQFKSKVKTRKVKRNAGEVSKYII
jgi:hypothetical protein